MFIYSMIMSNPIVGLFSKEVITGNTFPKWKLNLMLVSGSIRFVLIEDRPSFPGPNASKNLRDDYDKCVMANNKVVAYMLANIFDAL